MSSSPMRAFIKEHFVLIAGITLPLALIVLFSLARMVTDVAVAPPQYKAVYAQLDNSTYANGRFNYQVGPDGKLSVTWTGPQPYAGQQAQPPVMVRSYVMIFDPVTGTQNKFPFEVADSVKPGTVTVTSPQMPPIEITAGTVAPDGYTYDNGNTNYHRNGLFNDIFGGGSSYYDARYRIGKNGKSFMLPLQDRYSQFDFIGWTK